MIKLKRKKEDLGYVLVRMPESVRRELKMHCADMGISMQKLLLDYIMSVLSDPHY